MKFINNLNTKITVNEYLVKRLTYDGIHTGFGSNKYCNYSPFYGFIKDNLEFNVVFDNDNEFLIPYYAGSYYKNTGKIGIMFTSSRYGYTNLIKGIEKANYDYIPLLLISFYNIPEELKIPQKNIFKQRSWVNIPDNFPYVLENSLWVANMDKKGVTCISLSNKILNKKIPYF